MIKIIIICLTGLLFWVWLMGYLNALIFIPNLKKEESILFLKANGCDFIETKRHNHSSKKKSRKSLLEKIFFLNSRHIIIGFSKIENEFKIFNVIVEKTWIPFNHKREIYIIEERDDEILFAITRDYNIK